MDIDQLTAFERIVREGSFSRATWALGIAQPTISARMQAQEGVVGTLNALAEGFLGPVVARFYTNYPYVKLTIRSSDREQIVSMLSDGVIE